MLRRKLAPNPQLDRDSKSEIRSGTTSLTFVTRDTIAQFIRRDARGSDGDVHDITWEQAEDRGVTSITRGDIVT